MRSILELIAVAGAVLAFLFALLMAWGLSELGGAGRPVMSLFAALLLVAAAATLVVVIGGAHDWELAVAAAPPLLAVLLQLTDPSVLWGNFAPEHRRGRALQRVAPVALLALPVVAAGAAALV
jgi:hypothetical protein